MKVSPRARRLWRGGWKATALVLVCVMLADVMGWVSIAPSERIWISAAILTLTALNLYMTRWLKGRDPA